MRHRRVTLRPLFTAPTPARPEAAVGHGMTPAEFAERTAQAQGFPPRIENRAVIATVAELVGSRSEAVMPHAA